MFQKNTFGQKKFRILCTGSKVPFWQFFIFSKMALLNRCTEVRFASFLSGGFTTMAVINPREGKLTKRTSVDYSGEQIPLNF